MHGSFELLPGSAIVLFPETPGLGLNGGPIASAVSLVGTKSITILISGCELIIGVALGSIRILKVTAEVSDI